MTTGVDRVSVAFRNVATLSPETLEQRAAELVSRTIVALYGTVHLDDNGTLESFRLLNNATMRELFDIKDESERVAARELIALRMLGTSFDLSRLATRLSPSERIYTNGTHSDWVAALLIAPRLSRVWLEATGAESLVAVFPTDTRVLWSPHETAHNVRLMQTLASRVGPRVDGFLSDEMLRFDGIAWSSLVQNCPDNAA